MQGIGQVHSAGPSLQDQLQATPPTQEWLPPKSGAKRLQARRDLPPPLQSPALKALETLSATSVMGTETKTSWRIMGLNEIFCKKCQAISASTGVLNKYRYTYSSTDHDATVPGETMPSHVRV